MTVALADFVEPGQAPIGDSTEPAAAEPAVLFSQDGRVTTLVLHRPRRLNAMDEPMAGLLCDLVERLDPENVDAVVVTGDARSFCAGMDLQSTDFEVLGPGLDAGGLARNPMLTIEASPLPVIAAIEGHCVGAGFVLALACDIRVASTTATFAFPEVRRGFPPAGGIHRLARTIGPGRAKLMLYTGRTLDAQTMLEWGAIDELVEAGTACAAAQQLALEIGAAPAPAVGAVKGLVRDTTHLDGPAASALEFQRAATFTNSPETQARVAAFLASRPGQRRP